jgi:hypothetical protein
VAVTHALKLGIGTQTGLTYTFGATQGLHESVSVFCSTCRPASMWCWAALEMTTTGGRFVIPDYEAGSGIA